MRISAKKLRYSVELAQLTGVWKPRHLISDLRDVQDALGNLHDAQVLLDELDRLGAEGTAPAGEIQLLEQGLRGESPNGTPSTWRSAIDCRPSATHAIDLPESPRTRGGGPP